MRRGTTAKLTFTSDFDWADYTLQLTLEENEIELVFTEDRLTVNQGIVEVTLTQEETLKFNKKVQAQIKAKLGNSVIATDIASIPVLPILNEEVM